jgi:hypothetical protein
MHAADVLPVLFFSLKSDSAIDIAKFFFSLSFWKGAAARIVASNAMSEGSPDIRNPLYEPLFDVVSDSVLLPDTFFRRILSFFTD